MPTDVLYLTRERVSARRRSHATCPAVTSGHTAQQGMRYMVNPRTVDEIVTMRRTPTIVTRLRSRGYVSAPLTGGGKATAGSSPCR